MAIKKVWIEEGCISCGVCAGLCPDVFEMPEEAIVKTGADFVKNDVCIREVAEGCPVEIIRFEE